MKSELENQLIVPKGENPENRDRLGVCEILKNQEICQWLGTVNPTRGPSQQRGLVQGKIRTETER